MNVVYGSVSRGPGPGPNHKPIRATESEADESHSRLIGDNSVILRPSIPGTVPGRLPKQDLVRGECKASYFHWATTIILSQSTVRPGHQQFQPESGTPVWRKGKAILSLPGVVVRQEAFPNACRPRGMPRQSLWHT